MNKYEWEKSDADKIKEASRMIDEMLELIDKVKLESVSVKRWKLSLEKVKTALTQYKSIILTVQFAFLYNFSQLYFFYIQLHIGTKRKKLTTYVGYTKNINKRLNLHNKGKGAKFTRGRKWKLIYKEAFKSKSKAISREYYIKKNRTLRNKIKKKII